MVAQEFERMVERIVRVDFSAGTEGFREELLGRCLDVLGADDDGRCIEDAELELVAAAGTPEALFAQPSSGAGDDLMNWGTKAQ